MVRPPSIGWWFGSVVINTRAGDSFPALFFHDSECQSTILQRKRLARETFDPFGDGGGVFWGGDEVLRWLKQYVTVERSTPDPNVYLIEPTDEDRVGFNLQKEKQEQQASAQENRRKRSKDRQGRDGGMDPVTKAIKEARWNFLERLSQVTTFTRRTAQAIADNPRVPPQVKRIMQNPEVQTLQGEFDSAKIYLARWAMGIAEQSERERSQRIWTAKDVLEMEDSSVGEFEILDMEANNLSLAERRKPMTEEEWNGWFDAASGRLQVTPNEVKDRVFHGGLDPEDGVRKEAWLFLLGVYDWNSSKEERAALINSKRDEYLKLKGAWWERLAQASESASESEWWKEQRMRIGETSLQARTTLLDVSHGHPTLTQATEKDVHRTDRHVPLFAGEDIPHPDPDSPFAEVGTNVHLEQMKDLLLTYNEYNSSLGYVQGMSDLLAPIYAVMQDDAVAFWAFVAFMERMERNFLRDQSGMRLQLLTLDHLVQLMDPALYLHLQKADSTNFFFFFRMLLVWYKREFPFHDILRLWESLWTDFYSGEFQLFVALAILEKHRDVIVNHLEQFDEVLKYVNELAGTMDLSSTLLRAEGLFRRFQRAVEAVERKESFPAPSVAKRRRSASEGIVAQTLPASKPSSSPGRPQQDDQPQPMRSRQRQQSQTNRAKSSANDQGRVSGASDDDNVKEKVISPELRNLLSRCPPKMKQEEVKQHGGGVGT